MRLIDADKLYKEIDEGQKSALGLIESSKYGNITSIDDCLESIKYADEVDVSEVLNRAKELIKAYTDMCDGRNYGNLLSESTTYYDGCDCDSTCLKDDMESLLDDIEDVLSEMSADKDNTDYDDIEPDML